MNIRILALLTFITATTHLLPARDVRGYVIDMAEPDSAVAVYDFSTASQLGETVWEYSWHGDSAVSVTRPGMRLDYTVNADTLRRLCTEGRFWIIRDSAGATVSGPEIYAGNGTRTARVHQSEHYAGQHRYAMIPIGKCNVILAPGDTVRNAALTRLVSHTRLHPADIDFHPATDSAHIDIHTEEWYWSTSPAKPLIAHICTTEISYTGGKTSSRHTASIFPRAINTDIWPEEPDGHLNPLNLTDKTALRKPYGATSDSNSDPANNSAYPTIEAKITVLPDGTISVFTGTEAIQITVSDITGRIMHACEAAGTISIDTGGWPYGEYLIKAGQTPARKIILIP